MRFDTDLCRAVCRCATTIVMTGRRQLGCPVCDCRAAAIGKRQLAATTTRVRRQRRRWRRWREPSGVGSSRY
jgi:hypothetical protein